MTKSASGMGGNAPHHDSPYHDPLLSLLAVNAAWGAVLGVLFAAGAVLLDIGHLRQLIGMSTDGMIALMLLASGCIVTFASLAMGSAIMMIGNRRRENDDDGYRPVAELVPARVRAASRRRPTDGA